MIPYEVFQKAKTKSYSVRWQSLISDLRQKHVCFTSSGHVVPANSSLTSGLNVAWADTKKPPSKPKPSIATLAGVSEEKKRFLSILNKVTPETVDKLYSKYKETFEASHADLYIETVFAYIQRSSQFCSTYCTFLLKFQELFPLSEPVQRFANAFLTDQVWVPPVPAEKQENYDEFCDYQAWKRKVLAYIQAFAYFIQVRILPAEWIRQLTYGVIQQWNSVPRGSRLHEEMYLLELQECMKSKYCPTESVRRFIESANIEQMEPCAIKFALLDIQEALRQKMKNRLRNSRVQTQTK